ncbi:hypothetical protein ACVWZA_001919 [Sphingomonas sp. UYAg733]
MSRGPDAATLLVRALGRDADLARCPIDIGATDWTRWASATFSGARHTIRLSAPASARLDAWLTALPEAEIDLNGHLLASVAIESIQRSGDQVVIELEALTVEQ